MYPRLIPRTNLRNNNSKPPLFPHASCTFSVSPICDANKWKNYALLYENVCDDEEQ